MQYAARASPHAHLLCGVGPIADMGKALRGQGVLIHNSLLSSLRVWRRKLASRVHHGDAQAGDTQQLEPERQQKASGCSCNCGQVVVCYWHQVW